ncbi:proline-rich protein 2-like [Penaeus monodon]|uniref:proline-rich protein 2-like n=1 Tax=Penaeus monodon TaxID=6687 RepID=UPI0018A75952|nr:proline-rich protein 2-like [Penaeus monodon]
MPPPSRQESPTPGPVFTGPEVSTCRPLTRPPSSPSFERTLKNDQRNKTCFKTPPGAAHETRLPERTRADPDGIDGLARDPPTDPRTAGTRRLEPTDRPRTRPGTRPDLERDRRDSSGPRDASGLEPRTRDSADSDGTPSEDSRHGTPADRPATGPRLAPDPPAGPTTRTPPRDRREDSRRDRSGPATVPSYRHNILSPRSPPLMTPPDSPMTASCPITVPTRTLPRILSLPSYPHNSPPQPALAPRPGPARPDSRPRPPQDPPPTGPAHRTRPQDPAPRTRPQDPPTGPAPQDPPTGPAHRTPPPTGPEVGGPRKPVVAFWY